jgi:hypothetical protein
MTVASHLCLIFSCLFEAVEKKYHLVSVEDKSPSNLG